MVDEEGRPLHEVDFRDAMPAEEYAPSRFRDSRSGYLINLVAFRQMASVWDQVVALAEGFGHLTRATGATARDRLAHLWRASLAAMFFPVYVARRRDSPLHGQPIPISAAALFKVALDLPTTLDLLIIDGAAPTAAADGDIARFVVDFADATGILLNGDYACAGPPKLMDELIRSFLFREGHAVSSAGLGIEDLADYADFSAAMTVQYVIGYWFGLASGLLSEERWRAFGRSLADKPPAKPSAYERRRRYALERLGRDDQRQRAWARYREAMAALPAEIRHWPTSYFDEVRRILLDDSDPERFLERQRALETLSESALAACQNRLIARHGIDFAPKLELASFWKGLPRSLPI